MSIEGKEKLYKIPRRDLRYVLSAQSDSLTETLRQLENTSNHEVVLRLCVTVDDEETPHELRCFVTRGCATVTLDGIESFQCDNVIVYDRLFVWEAGFRNQVFDLEECFPRIRVCAAPKPNLINEVRAIKDLLIEIIARMQWNQDIKNEKEQKDKDEGALE